MGLFDKFKKKKEPVIEKPKKPEIDCSGFKNPFDFEDAFKNAESYQAEEQIISSYIDFIFKGEGKDYILVSSLDDAIRDFGFANNPFIEYTKLLIKHKVKLSDDQFNLVRIAYESEGKFVDDHDLWGRGYDGEDHIIFNKYFFSQLSDSSNEEEDFKFCIMLYKKLTKYQPDKPYKTTKLNIGDKTYNLKKDFDSLETDEGVLKFKNALFFVNCKPGGPVRSASEIKGILLQLDQ